jgi:hypothetical protein
MIVPQLADHEFRLVSIDVIAENSGVGSIEEDFTYILTYANRWSQVGRIVISAEHEDSLITGYSIPPTQTTLKAATWEFNSVPVEDLTMRWKVLVSPVRTQVSGAALESNPIIAPIVALVVVGMIAAAIVYVKKKKRRAYQ